MKKKESGNVIDMMAGAFMMIFIFAVILVMIAYFALVDKKMDINNAVKNYMYIAEQQGGLTAADVQALKSFLETNYDCVVSPDSIKINGTQNWISDSGAVSSQVPYGSSIELSVEVDFPNPIYQVVGLTSAQLADGGGDKYWFRIGAAPFIRYKKSLTSTSRW